MGPAQKVSLWPQIHPIRGYPRESPDLHASIQAPVFSNVRESSSRNCFRCQPSVAAWWAVMENGIQILPASSRKAPASKLGKKYPLGLWVRREKLSKENQGTQEMT